MYKNGWIFWFFIFSSLAPNSTWTFVSLHTLFTVFVSYSRLVGGWRRRKLKYITLYITQLFYKKYSKLLSMTSKSHHFATLGITSLYLSLSHSLFSPSQLATIASVEFSWFETKTYPIATHLDARNLFPSPSKQPEPHRRSTTRVQIQIVTNGGYASTWIDWVGRTQGETKTLHSNPVFFLFAVSGRESYVCTRCSRNRELERTHTSNSITSISMTSHWPTPLRFNVELVFAHDCVCVSEQSNRVSSECDENFQFQNGDRRFFATCVFGFFGWWENVSRRRFRRLP